MEFGLDTAVFKQGKLVQNQNGQLNDQTVIKNMDTNKTYKYLCVEETQMKEDRERVLSSSLSGFQDWVKLQKQSHSYENPSCSSRGLQLWYHWLVDNRYWDN